MCCAGTSQNGRTPLLLIFVSMLALAGSLHAGSGSQANGGLGHFHFQAGGNVDATVYREFPPDSAKTTVTVSNSGPGEVLVTVRYFDRGIPVVDEVIIGPSDPPVRLKHPFVSEVTLHLQSGSEASGTVLIS